MDPASADALVAAFQEFDRDSDAAVAVLWGEGGAFCAGWDLKYCATMIKDAKELHGIDYPLDDRKSIPRGPLGPTRLELDKPVIAAVAGPAVAGGFELALWCDVRVMEESAYFGVYCRRWGVPLIDGGTVRLPRIVGTGRALDLVLTGRSVDAAEALQMGLVNRVVPAGEALPAAQALAAQLAAFPQTCLREDRASLLEQEGLAEAAALANEFRHGMTSLAADALPGAAGEGRHGAGV
jgi:enoyl-CoA hydratase